MVPAFSFLEGFASFITERTSSIFHLYSGYRGGSGSLLVKIRDSDLRVVLKPWGRDRALGLTDLLRTQSRLLQFRRQSVNCHVHIATSFRDNAVRYVGVNRGLSLITIDSKKRAIY